MKNFLFLIIENLSLVIGIIGIFIILVGTVHGFIRYLFSKNSFEKSRLTLSRHLILGLDFLVAKDIIDTFLLARSQPNKEILINLICIITVVTIRVILNYFLEREIESIRHKKEFKDY